MSMFADYLRIAHLLSPSPWRQKLINIARNEVFREKQLEEEIAVVIAETVGSGEETVDEEDRILAMFAHKATMRKTFEGRHCPHGTDSAVAHLCRLCLEAFRQEEWESSGRARREAEMRERLRLLAAGREAARIEREAQEDRR